MHMYLSASPQICKYKAVAHSSDCVLQDINLLLPWLTLSYLICIAILSFYLLVIASFCNASAVWLDSKYLKAL